MDTEPVERLTYDRPAVTRSHRADFDKCEWPDGLHVIRYDDGRVKIGWLDHSVALTSVENHAPGKSRGAGHIIARFSPLGPR